MSKGSTQPNPAKKDLRIMNQCPVCNNSYEAGQDNVLEHRSGAHLVHITCPDCQNSVLAVVMVSQSGLSSVGMLTDMSASDVLRVHRRGGITEDELLNMHLLIKNKNFSKIINNI